MSSYGGDRSAQAGSLGYSPLVGGEAVQMDLRVARIGSRAVAAFMDLVFELVVSAFVGTLLGTVVHIDIAAQRALSILAFVLIFLGYPVLSETAWDGRTLGKAAMGLRAARDDGGPLRFRHALVRGLTGLFIEKPGISLGFAAVLCSLLSARGKRLGDLFAGTVVLQVRLPSSGAYLPPMPPPLAGWATTLDLSRFNDALALQCRQFLGRAGQLSEESRERLGASLVAAVQAVVVTPPPHGTPGWAYLAAVLAERRRREEQHLYGNANAGMPVSPVYPGWPAPGGPPAATVGLHKQPAEPTPPDRDTRGPFATPG